VITSARALERAGPEDGRFIPKPYSLRAMTDLIGEISDAGLRGKTLASGGGLGFTRSAVATHTLTHYRRKVRANRRRLSK